VFKFLFVASLVYVLVLGQVPTASAEDTATVHHDVSFVSQGATLRGTVYIPSKAPIVAGAVWVDGSGETKRKPGLAEYLARSGLALLTYDKRGVGKSGGVYAGPEIGTNNVSVENLTLLADDAVAALQSLSTEKLLHGRPLGFIGASQAGWIIPLAALKSHQARFMVLWSGPVETTHEEVLFEQMVTGGDPEFWDHHTNEEVQKTMSGIPDRFVWPDFDPRAALSKLKIPGLWFFGGRDRKVYVDLSIDNLNALIAAGHINYSYMLFPGYDHNLAGEQRDVIDPLLAWIRQVVHTPPAGCEPHLKASGN
jgi:pimeloyl-ACP methyl ester carboxylesterase